MPGPVVQNVFAVVLATVISASGATIVSTTVAVRLLEKEIDSNTELFNTKLETVHSELGIVKEIVTLMNQAQIELAKRGQWMENAERRLRSLESVTREQDKELSRIHSKISKLSK